MEWQAAAATGKRTRNMTNPSGGLTLEEQTIHKAARRARTLRTCVRGMVWTTMIFTLVALSIAMSRPHPPDEMHSRLDMLLVLPLFLMFVWMVVEWIRAIMAYRKLTAIFVPGHNHVRQSVSYSTIGSLLDVMT